MKVAVFGSAFNPPTYSHMRIIEGLTDIFDKIIVVPCFSHNFGKKMIDFEHRFEMAKILTNHIGGKVLLSSIEKEIFKNEVSRTYLLLKELKRLNPEDDFIFVCGEDNATPENWTKFYKYESIDKEFGKHVIPDMGSIRSTLIRNKLKNGESISGLTKPEIIEYLTTNKIKF